MCVTNWDMQRIRKLLEEAQKPIQIDMECLKRFDEKLNQAVLVSSEKVPVDFVTLNTRMRVRDLDSSEEILVQLVFPSDADPNWGKISILSPIGAALIGYRAGDTVEWKVSSGIRRLLILEITYQPESEGLL